MKHKRTTLLISFTIIIVLELLMPIKTVGSQQLASDWQPVVILSGRRAQATWPTVAIDKYKRVHVFWAQTIRTKDTDVYVIMHTMKTAQGEWLPPNDIMIRDSWVYSYPHAVIANDNIYLIWAEWSGIYFSVSSAIGSENASNWQKKSLITSQPSINQNSIIIGQSGTLHIIFTTLGADLHGDGNTYYLKSSNSGKDWTFTEKISDVLDPINVVTANPHLAIDSQGLLFAVWGEARNLSTNNGSNWRERTVYITKSLDNGKSWGKPLKVSEPNPTQELWQAAPSIVVDTEDKIHLVWTCGEITNRCYRFSSDHGATWSPVEKILSPFASLAGWDSMVGTPDGSIHVLAQLRYPENVYHSVKPLHGDWVGPIPISHNPDITVAHFPEATTDGERLLVVFQQSDRPGPIWFTEGWLKKTITFPVIPEITPTNPAPVLRSTSQIKRNEAINTPTMVVTVGKTEKRPSMHRPIFLGILSSALLIGIILSIKHYVLIRR